jgi:circadian clock protein KaiC
MSGRKTGPELARVGTGSRGADTILHGGFPANSINILMGLPGTGKTVLAQQLLFHNAEGERPVAFLSTLSEPLAKVLTFLQGFEFYDEATLLDSIIYEDVGQSLLAEGPGQLTEHVRDLIRQRGPRILVIDSFKAIHDLTGSTEQIRRLAFGLGALLSAYDITSFLVGEYSDSDVATSPEFAVADGIVQLERRGSEKADERYLRVLKLRGSAYAEGLHAFTIGSAGMEVYPRLVTPAIPSTFRPAMEQIATGVEGLDALVGGGLWRGSTTLVAGSSGTGKTTLGLAFAIEGVRSGEQVLYLNLQESPTQLEQTIRRLGADYDGLRRRGLHLQYESPVELRIDALVVRLSEVLREHGVERVVIDGLTELRWAAASEVRFHDYLYALTQHFRASDVTAILTMEVPPQRSSEALRHQSRVSSLSDGLILLANVADGNLAERRIRVVKMRGSDHPLESRPFTITSRGIRVSESGEELPADA